MRFPAFPRLRLPARLTILIVVGIFGLATTAWLTREIQRNADERQQQRFQIAAREHADRAVKALAEPLGGFSTLQRFFHSVGEVDPAVFNHFATPMIDHDGVRCIGWAPAVDDARRALFEKSGEGLWGSDFAIQDIDIQGGNIRAAPRERYFPVLYVVAGEVNPLLPGQDIYRPEKSRALIDQAVGENSPIASAPDSQSIFAHDADEHSLIFLVPVYRGQSVTGVSTARLAGAERRSAVRGILFMTLDTAGIFARINDEGRRSGLEISLVDPANPTKRPTRLAYERSFALASRPMKIHIAADPTWFADSANDVSNLNDAKNPASPTNPAIYVSAVGILLTLLLLAYLHRLLGRSALADVLVRTHENDLRQQRIAEGWVNKLSLVVEQNPASIAIIDLDGTIEYVNAKFIETTGYSREAALGRNMRILRPGIADARSYRQLTQAVTAGQSWNGELQSQRADGTQLWERVLVSPIRDPHGAITHYVAISENVTELRTMMTRLVESEARFRGAVSVMVEGLIILSSEGHFIFANRAAEEFLGFAADGLQDLTWQEIDLERVDEDGTPCPLSSDPVMIALREGCEVHDRLIGYRFAGGPVRWVEINAAPLRTGDDPLPGAVVTFSEMTGRQRAEEQLKLAFEAIRCSGEGILVTDAERRILSVNPAFEAVTGYSAQEVAGKDPAIVASTRHDERFYTAMHETLERNGYWQGEIWNQRKNGEIYPEWLGVSVVHERNGRPKYYVYIFSDMSERKAAQERIEFLAHHDPLTGLPNRLLLRDRVEQAQAHAIRTNCQVALMFLDLDRFKTINDSLGHPVGDTLLKEVVERLKGCVRESDTVCRQGGDEFIILLNDIRDRDAVTRVAEKIHQRMADPFVLGGHALNTSFSIGIALYPDDGEDFDGLLQKADTAMYHAKEAGRNVHRFFTEQMNQQVVEHLTLETQLRKALENREFVLHYQPQMDLRDGTIVGVEALIRWNSPENGLVSPARFIPVAEVSGLIVPIGAWVIEEACRQAHAWQVAGLLPLVMAVNLSAVQFRRHDLINTVINALVLSDLDSQWLELELTESILLQDAESTLDAVRRLKALGVKLSVDDFGTGYSSLAYLKRFSVDKLKIDQSFIRDLESDPDDAAIVRAIIQMAHSLKLKTIAEGVENEALTNLLRIFNCDEIQGYGFAHPMPADQLEAFVRAQHARQRRE